MGEMEVEQGYQVDFNVLISSHDFYDKCELYLNSSQTFSITIKDKGEINYIKKYTSFFKSFDFKNINKLAIPITLNWFTFKHTKELYDIFLLALLYKNNIKVKNENSKIEIIFLPTESINRNDFFNSIERETFPNISYPKKKYYAHAVEHLQSVPFLVTTLTDRKKIQSFLVNYLVQKNIIDCTQFLYPLFLKMFLDYVTLQLNWNIIFYIEQHKLIILCTKYKNNELIEKRKLH